MGKYLRVLSVFILLYWSGGISALPLTYDFGFTGEVEGTSGQGYFTLSELNGGPPGLDTFEYTGLCGGDACTFTLADIYFQNWIVDIDGNFSEMAILGGQIYSHYSYGLSVNLTGVGMLCYDDASQPDKCNDKPTAERLGSYSDGSAYLTLRESNPTPAPVPPTLFLFVVSLTGLYIFRRTRPLPI